MNKTTSLYLDLVRFGAAMAVFFCHLSAESLTGGRIAWAGTQGDTAVAVFFVLSGFVIAHVLATRERTCLDYAASRFARLYSVVLPGLVLAATCDHIGSLHDPGLYAWNSDGSHGSFVAPARFFADLFFVNRFWIVHGGQGFEFGTDRPLWSLSFEVVYYVAIAIAVFARGWMRPLLLIVLCLIAGPDIVALAPLWAVGFGLYHLPNNWNWSRPLALLLWCAGLIACLSAFLLRDIDFRTAIPMVWRFHADLGLYLARCVAAGGFAVSLMGFLQWKPAGTFLARFEKTIRRLGALSFPLYVVHRPLLFFLCAFSPVRENVALNLAWLVIATLLPVALIAPALDATKPYYRRAFLRRCQLILGKPAAMPYKS